jgi:hypothetical protein
MTEIIENHNELVAYFRNRLTKKLEEQQNAERTKNKIQLSPENEGLFHRISDIVVGVCSKGILKSTGIVNIKIKSEELPQIGDIIIADSKGFGKIANKDEIINNLFNHSVVGTYLGKISESLANPVRFEVGQRSEPTFFGQILLR